MTRLLHHSAAWTLAAAVLCGTAAGELPAEAAEKPVLTRPPAKLPPPRVAKNKTVQQQVKEIQRQQLSPKHLASISKRKAGERKQKLKLHEFVDKSGVMTITNRPDKYKNNRLYTPVDITYKPVTVPNEYKRFKSAKQYTSQNIASLITHYANLNGLDEDLVYAIIKAESDFNTNALSPAGACGLMQLMPGTAAEMGVTQIFDPAQNIAGGTEYIAKMLDIFKNDTRLALAAYNAGPNAVQQYGGIPPYQETQVYVERVLGYHHGFKTGGVVARNTGAKAYRAAKVTPKARPANAGSKAFLVYFHSGLTQPADRVVDKDPYYYIEYGNLVYPVRKDLVQRVAQS